MFGRSVNGQLTCEKYGHDAVLVWFTTHHGTVTAASDWDKPAERKRVRPGLPAATRRYSRKSSCMTGAIHT
jgi:erythromycin esterase-like protein